MWAPPCDDRPVGQVLAAVGLFAGTNVDDLLVLTVLFLAWRANGVPARHQIWTGQYLGIAALVAFSVVAAVGLLVVPGEWVRWLGFVPIALGVRGLAGALRDAPQERRPVAATAWTIAGVTIANGADNIAVYTPVFRTIGMVPTLITIAVFAVLTAVWCLAGGWLASHRQVVRVVERFGHWIVPLVFIAIGALILLS